MEQSTPIKELIAEFSPLFNGFAKEEDLQKAFATILSDNGLINLDAMDLRTTLMDCKEADLLISLGQPEDLKELLTAQKMVLDSKHPDKELKKLLVQLCINPKSDLMMQHMNGVTEFFNSLDENVDIIWGLSREEDVPVGEVEIIVVVGF